MRKSILACLFAVMAVIFIPKMALAAGIGAGGGSLKYPGDTTTVSITASGTTFNAFQGAISSSGSVKITGCTPGDALWVTKPAGAGGFVGALTNAVSSFRIATCSIRASTTGSGSVSVSGVQLANSSGSIVGTDGGSVSFNIVRQPTPPGAVTVTSSSHPDQNTAYEATTIVLNWAAPTSNTSGYSYLLDQTADTIPPSTVTNNSLTVSYPAEAVGTYYFHIKALNSDGWGAVTHFKVTIKEPDPKIQDTLSKPHDLMVVKDPTFKNNIADGTVSGFVISGITEPNFMANIILDPAPKIPEGKILSVKSDINGKFSFLVDFPLPAGNYKLTIQGQNNKILTPVSDPLHFEISQAKGGSINILTANDTNPPIIPPKKWYEKINWMTVSIVLGSAVVILGIMMITIFIGNKRNLKKIT